MFDKNAISRENLYYANLKRDKRIKDQLDEMEREKKAMEKLNYQIEQEKLFQIEKKNQIKQNQYEDYNNYLRQKYSTPPQFREKLNIKLGGEERNIKKTTYNEQMDNLCLNPTRQKNIYPTTPVINYSEMGRNYQKGYSHGYNIITGEVYSHQYNNNRSEKNQNNNQSENINQNKGNNLNNKNVENQNYNYNNINISPEEYEEFLKYKEMKRQKELEQIELEKEKYNNYINNNQNNPQNENAPNYKREENELNYNERQYPNEIPPSQYQKEQLYNNNINEQNDMKYYQQKIPPEYNNLNQNIKDNFHYDKDNINPDLRNNLNDKNIIENMYKETLYKQNQFYEDYERRFLQNQQREKEQNQYNNKIPENNNPNYYQQKDIPQRPYDYKNDIRKEEQFYPPQNYERQKYENIPLEYQRREMEKNNNLPPVEYQRREMENNNNLPPVEYQRNMELNQQQNIPYGYSQRENNIQSNYERENNQNDNDEIQFRNNISLQNNQPMPEYQNQKIQPIPREENYDKDKNIKDIERERYMQFLMSKTNENKEQNGREMNNNRDNMYNNNNFINEKAYNEKMMKYPQRGEENPNNYYENHEKDYYTNYQREPIQYNNYMRQNKNYNYNQYERERQREYDERNYQEEQEPKYLSYQEQIERIKKQEQNKNISENNENDTQNKNAKEIISQYNENKRKNTNSEDHIFNVEQVPPTPPKYSDEPLTNKERKQIQREYAKYLDWQINEKNARNAKTPMYKQFNPILDSDNSDMKKNDNGQNFAQHMRDNNNIIKREIPINPYYNYKTSNEQYGNNYNQNK